MFRDIPIFERGQTLTDLWLDEFTVTVQWTDFF